MTMPDTTRWRALVVDDEDVICLLVESLLASEGFEVTCAGTGAQAEALLRSEEPFDLLVTDKNLPRPDGLELAALARKLRPQMGLVVMTAYASGQSAAILQRIGVDEYLLKPFDADYFIRRAREIVEQRARASPAQTPASHAAGAARVASAPRASVLAPASPATPPPPRS